MRWRQSHDTFLKRFYRLAAPDAIRLFFPEVAQHIDWDTLEWTEKEILIPGEDPRSVVADLVGRTKDREGRYLEVLVHPEIQMERRPNMGWRATLYNSGLLMQEAHPDVRVLTFVFYHCRGSGGIREEDHRMEFFGRTVHHVGYWSVGLGDLDAEAYVRNENPVAWALAAWMRQQRAGRAELRLRLMERILRFVANVDYRRVLIDAVRSYFKLNPTEREEEQRLLQTQMYGEVGEMFQTELDKLEAKARREGETQARRQMLSEFERLEAKARQEGEMQARRQMLSEFERLEAKARQEGGAQALHQALLGVVQSRFPEAPEALIDRVRQVQDPARLEDLIGRAAVATSLEEIERLLQP